MTRNMVTIPDSFPGPPRAKGSHPRRNSTTFSDCRRFLSILIFLAPISLSSQTVLRGGCNETPREDALPFLCAPSTSEILEPKAPDSVILLKVPAGTTLRVAVDHRVRIAKLGQTVSGKVTEPVYVFDQTVIPAGSVVTGRVTSIDPIAARERNIVVRKREVFSLP
jgi:hypothetical protein